jgi:hypothetical protein
MSDSGRGFGLDNRFVGHFNTELVVTLNCNAIVNFHTLQITSVHANYFPVRSVFTSSWLVTASTMANHLLPCSSPVWMGLLSDRWICTPVILLITPRHEPLQKTPFPIDSPLLRAHCSHWNLFVRDRYLEMNVSVPFATNGCFSGPTVLALSKYATILWYSC